MCPQWTQKTQDLTDFFMQGLINGQFNIRNLLSSGRYGYHSVPFDAGRSSGFYPSR
jgi:hypothetical protein